MKIEVKIFHCGNTNQIGFLAINIYDSNNLKKRKEFFKMLDDIISGKVERVVMTYKNRLREC